MYIQITDRCNMKCDHCCMDSHSRRKGFMAANVFEMALEVAKQYGMAVTVGGGEPTLHPKIFEYLRAVMMAYAWGELECAPFMVTNGKNYNRAKKIFELTQPDDTGMYPIYDIFGYVSEYREEPLLRVELSTDYFHESIDYRIEKLYKNAERRKDPGAGTRDVTIFNNVKGIGRALKTGVAGYDPKECACETLFVDPTGDVYSCGCKHTKLGTIWKYESILENYNEEYAHKGGIES